MKYDNEVKYNEFNCAMLIQRHVRYMNYRSFNTLLQESLIKCFENQILFLISR